MNLQDIIQLIKETALASGFISVEEKQVNEKDISDTETPKMFIKLEKIEYDKQMMSSMQEHYFFQLLIVAEDNETPITTLKTLQDEFMRQLLSSENYDFKNLINQECLKFTDTTVSNVVGSNSAILSLNIINQISL